MPLTCQFAVELLQEAGLSGVAGEKNKADWVGTRLMVDLYLCDGKNECVRSCMRGVVGISVQSLHAPSKNLNDSRFEPHAQHVKDGSRTNRSDLLVVDALCKLLPHLVSL